jgi:hypothetical protein
MCRFVFLFLALAALSFGNINALEVSGLTFQNSMKPGETTRATITLISDKNQPEIVDLKLCDYSCNSDGQHFFEDASKQARSNASWISLGSHREIVNPGERKEIYFTIKVPPDQNMTGSYWSVLLIEPSDPLHTMAESEHGLQLQVKIRYAFHIVTDVGTSKPALKVVKKEIEQLDGKNYFAVDVENTGNLFLNPKLTIKLFTKQGKLEKTMETQTERLYPGSSARFFADSQGVSAGKYTAFLLLDNADGKIFGDSFEIAMP